ncbi:polysaccharide deacetylase family protein [Corynebacterium sp. TA-R-1]|uniref:Polysaccharide deacetylase family protein n=1 Tax=Corynebacterium stercoris TaxID=2943490 RepID=A0ABT1FZE0_9CORY|nr:polysaccharide deacetylase family protein [Corynebacterium stercoris]MCP1387132.1 polysaccharide deacetylase family protein [Corynebacterium stercoris]
MNRVAKAAAAALCSLALIAPVVQPSPAAGLTRVEQFSSTSSDAAHNAWWQGFNLLPPQVRGAIPRELRPADPAPQPAPPPAPEAPQGHPEPTPDTCDNCVAITFDDGPVGDTDRLLDMLKEKDAKATFFVVGSNAKANPKIMQRMRDEGHTIANHTYNHPRLPKLSDGAIGKQLDDTNAAIAETTGVTPRWMRPPYGMYDNRVVAASGDRGLAVALWDVDTSDWKHRDTAKTCKLAVEGAKPGSVILMHDIHRPTVDAVPCVIDGLREKGLRPVSMDRLISNPAAGTVYTRR